MLNGVDSLSHQNIKLEIDKELYLTKNVPLSVQSKFCDKGSMKSELYSFDVEKNLSIII